MRILRRMARAVLFGLAGFAAIVLLYFAGSIAGAAIPSGPAPAVAGAGQAERIYLATSMLHADFAIPATDAIKARFTFLREAGIPLDHPELRYLVFGWGGRDFYTKTPSLSDIRPLPLLKGVFGDKSVMHVLAARDVSADAGIVAVDLPAGGLDRLATYLERSFARDAAGAPVHMAGVSYGPADAFFDGVGSFNVLKPCNIWVARGLREAGLRTGLWTPTTHSLRLGLGWHAAGALPR